MRPTKKIGNTHEEEMNLILEFILNFDVQRLLYAINGKELREEDIISLTIDINDYYNKLSRQKLHLFKFGKTFNSEYATNDNKCYDTSLKLSRRMRSGMAGIKDAIIKPFVKISRKRLPDGRPNPSIMERSMISTENYSADLYGLSSYPECVKELFITMLKFYELLDDCITECKRVLKEEKEVKSSERLSMERFLQACEKSRKNQLHVIEAVEQEPAFREALKQSLTLSSDDANPVLKAYKKNSMSGAFVCQYFHNCTPSDIGKITLYRAWNESGDDPLMMLAYMVFGHDDKRIQRINHVIEHFDELLPLVCKRGTIPAYHLFVFMEWCGSISGIDSFLNYFEKYYLAHDGKWKVVGKSAITGAKNRPITSGKSSDYNKIRSEMLKSIDLLLEGFEVSCRFVSVS